ncbi:AbgT family transporter [Kocuria sp. CPCC 205233]|uniref:AbgT family transporter n=1 Tax=Kocuria sp. CPCC 205233 TaxID=3073550 RepID=UPI0034D5CF9E
MNGVEWVGNKSPHPFWLFVILAGLVAVLSAGLETAGVTAQNPATGDAETVLTRMTKKYHAEERSEAEAARAAEAGDGEHTETFTAQTLTVLSRRETTALWAAVGS